MEDLDPVRTAAQRTVDAIDAQMRDLGAARESLVKIFALGVRLPAPECVLTALTAPEAPETAPTPVLAPPAPQNGVKTHSEGYTKVYDKVGAERRERHQAQRESVLRYLKAYGPQRVSGLRADFKIGPRAVRFVLEHPWFSREGAMLGLTEAGAAEAVRLLGENGNGE